MDRASLRLRTRAVAVAEDVASASRLRKHLPLLRKTVGVGVAADVARLPLLRLLRLLRRAVVVGMAEHMARLSQPLLRSRMALQRAVVEGVGVVPSRMDRMRPPLRLLRSVMVAAAAAVV